MLSNKLTFSLASLVVLIAFGLVFGTGSVMAHPVTEANMAADQIHEGDAIGLDHMHPTVMVSVMDADPTMMGLQVVDVEEDTPAVLTIVFNVTFTLSEGAATAPFTITADSAATAADDVDFISYNNAFGAIDNGTLSLGALTVVPDSDNEQWSTAVTITLADDGDADTTDAQQRAAVNMAGVKIEVRVPDGAFDSAARAGTLFGQSNLASMTEITLIGEAPLDPTDATIEVAADTYHGGARFMVTISIDDTTDAPAPTLTLQQIYDSIDAGDNARVVPGSVKVVDEPEDDMMQWTAIIEPLLSTEMGDVVVTFMGDDLEAAAAMGMATVMRAASTVITPPTVTPPPDAKAATGDIGAGIVNFALATADVAAGRFIVIAANPGGAEITSDAGYTLFYVDDADLVDLEDFFRFGGGTIELLGPSDSADKDIVISEIMWAGDTQYPSTDERGRRMAGQWIELYVSAGGTSKDGATTAAKAGAWTLRFTRGAGAPAAVPTGYKVVDVMSNHGLGRWDVTGGSYGQNGRTRTEATTTRAAVAAEPFISMYRKINYTDAASAEKTRKDQLGAIPDGTRSGSWAASSSDRGANQNGLRYATPGAQHVSDLITAGAQSVARDGVVFNEIANRSDKKNEWIELYNGGTKAVNIKNWVLSVVTGPGKDAKLFAFEGDEDITIPSKGYLLVVNTDPASTGLAAGRNISEKNPKARGVDTVYYVDSALDIPKEKFLLVLRNEDRSGDNKTNAHEKIIDIAGNYDKATFMLDGAIGTKSYKTDVWPLESHPAFAGDDVKEDDGNSWVRDQGKGFDSGDAWKTAGYLGLGYDRNATINSGSPGYANDGQKAARVDADGKAQYTGTISISEIMVESNGGRAPQWIELYNNSTTQAVKLENWILEIQNYNSDDLDGNLNSEIKLGAIVVSPNQTVLIVSSTSGRVSPRVFDNDDLVYSLFDNHADDLGMENRRDTVISEMGFYIALRTPRPDNKIADSIGNLDGDRKSRDEPAWALPEAGDDRASLVRVYIGDGEPDDGTTAEGWKSSTLITVFDSDGTYYGDPDDLGSPGWRSGGALPVSLSKFRPERSKSTGQVVITWVTESEIDNAGFNILRSETKNGDFKVINLKGIVPGHGTTSERHVYTFTDTTAKPNVVYYYQIEDVSLDGKRTGLAQTHLRGNVSAAGKATTTWADLKSQK